MTWKVGGLKHWAARPSTLDTRRGRRISYSKELSNLDCEIAIVFIAQLHHRFVNDSLVDDSAYGMSSVLFSAQCKGLGFQW